MASSSSTRREGPELPPTRPTLATTHPQLASLGERIIVDIHGLMDKRSKSSTGQDFAELTAQLPGIFDNVLGLIATALVTRGHYDNVAH
jgi:hypothetical protein